MYNVRTLVHLVKGVLDDGARLPARLTWPADWGLGRQLLPLMLGRGFAEFGFDAVTSALPHKRNATVPLVARRWLAVLPPGALSAASTASLPPRDRAAHAAPSRSVVSRESS